MPIAKSDQQTKNKKKTTKTSKPKTSTAPRKKTQPTTMTSKRVNDKRVIKMNLSAGANDMTSPAPLQFPIPSDSLTLIRYEPHFANISIFASALTASMMSKSNISAQFNPQVYNNFYQKTCEVILEGMKGAAVPSISPLPYALACVFYAFNTIKQSGYQPNGTRLQYQVVVSGNVIVPPTVSFGAADLDADSNGFRKLPPFNPGSAEEVDDSFRTLLASTDLRLWKVGDAAPKLSNGISQFSNLLPGGNVQSFSGQDFMANTFSPLSFPIMAGLGLVKPLSPSILGKYNTPLYGNPALYSGYFCTHHLRDPRERVTAALISVNEFMPLVVGLMKGVNEQAVYNGKDIIFQDVVPEFLVAQVLNCIASSQQRFFPMTMSIVSGSGKSVRAGTQFPPRDVTSAGVNLFHLLIVEAMRRYNVITVKVPDEAYKNSSARLVVVPVFIVAPDIFEITRGVLDYATITRQPAASDIDPVNWSEASTGVPLTYATSNAYSGSPWEVFITNYRNYGARLGNYSPQFATTQQIESGLCLTHFFRIYVEPVAARVTLDAAILAAAGHKQKRLIMLRDIVKAPLAKTSTWYEGRPPFATCTFALFTPGSNHFMNLPVPYSVINMDNSGDIVSSATAQIPGWIQITQVNTPVGYVFYKSLFETGYANVFSPLKGEAPTELLKLLMNRTNAGLGGALDDHIRLANELGKGIYRVVAKNPNDKKYDAIAKPATQLLSSILKPVSKEYDYFMG